MKIMGYILLLVIGALSTACGPLSGQFNKTAEGLQNYEVVRGDIMKFKEARNLLVIGPFWGKGTEQQSCATKEDCIYPYDMDMKFVTKYNDARRFAHGLQEADIFTTELYLERYYPTVKETIKRMKTMSRADIKREFKLKLLPDMVLLGAVKKRENKVAPMRGVIVDVQYELEFYSPETRQSILINVAVIGKFKDDMKTVIEETKRRLAVTM